MFQFALKNILKFTTTVNIFGAEIHVAEMRQASKFDLKTCLNASTEQRTLKNVNNCLNTNIYSYLEASGGQSSKLYLNVVHFFNTSLN
jgi:hypothetical protein